MTDIKDTKERMTDERAKRRRVMNSISLGEFFGNSFVISIKEDSLQEFHRVFSLYFPGFALPRHYRGSRISGLGTERNITISHLGIVRTAKALKLPFVTIFEDDAYPRADIVKKLGSTLADIPDDAAVIQLGWIEQSGGSRRGCTDEICRYSGGHVWGAHAYIMFDSFYDKYIDRLEKAGNAVADHLVDMFGSVLVSKDNLFIQRPTVNSFHHPKGYIYDTASRLKSAPLPPSGFVHMPFPDENAVANSQLDSIMRGRSGDPVAILTFLVDQNNYGQRLQNYALQRYLQDEFGRTAVTIDSDQSRHRADLGDGMYFHPFERECMNIVDARNTSASFFDRFSHVIIGGDQILNQDIGHSKVPLRLIQGIAGRKVFSYGAGAAVRNPLKDSLHVKLEKNIIAHGLREDYGYPDYVKTIDPVFLLHDKWGDIDRGDEIQGGTFKYIVEWGSAKEVSRTRSDGTYVYRQGKGARTADPRDFLGLIRGADAAVTNSYHGFCLSLIHRVPRIDLRMDDHRTRNVIRTLGVRIEGGVVKNYDEIFERIRSEVAKARDYIATCLSSHPVDYCCYSKDKAVRDLSTSGGAAFELARVVMESGGDVYGGAFSEDFRKVVPKRARTADEYRSWLSKSKYSFCPLPDMDELKEELASGREVMYIGSPCHVRAVRKLLGTVPDNLLLVDFRCRGYSRPDKLSRFIDRVSSDTGKKVTSVDFRPNHGSKLQVWFDDGSSRQYGDCCDFFNDSMPMCRRCRLCHGKLSFADITVGDFWLNKGDCLGFGKDFTPEMGCSIVSVNTVKGAGLWRRIEDRVDFRPVIAKNKEV